MNFRHRKRRQPPAIIIISLIDILIVLLIFLMVSTTFKQTPAVKLSLPDSRQPKEGASEKTVIVTVAKVAPYIYLESRPVTVEKLRDDLVQRVAKNPLISLAIRADTASPWGEVVKVMDAGKAAKVHDMTFFTKK
jgi:biopolymer transport protein ExbD